MGVIYSIINKINNACYIGSSKSNGESRWKRHLNDLNKNIHHSQHLQRAYNKYGKENFIFFILEVVENNKNLIRKEQEYLNDRKNNYPYNLNYNVCWIAGNCEGRKFSDATKLKMSIARMGKKPSLESRQKMSKSHSERINKTYTLISPDNKEVTFSNIRKFCRDNNLDNISIGLLIRGKIYYYKGWIKDYNHTYSFIDPDGVTYDHIINLTNFCKEHHLKMKGMSKLHRGYVKSYFGWVNNNKNN